jgi:hypothetical protein
MGLIEEYEKQQKLKKQPTCRHKYLIGKSNGKFECVDCDIQLYKLPKERKLMF